MRISFRESRERRCWTVSQVRLIFRKWRCCLVDIRLEWHLSVFFRVTLKMWSYKHTVIANDLPYGSRYHYWIEFKFLVDISWFLYTFSTMFWKQYSRFQEILHFFINFFQLHTCSTKLGRTENVQSFSVKKLWTNY